MYWYYASSYMHSYSPPVIILYRLTFLPAFLTCMVPCTYYYFMNVFCLVFLHVSVLKYNLVD